MPSPLPKRLLCLCLLLPYILWLFIFNQSVLGHKALLHDTFVDYCVFKYFFNNLFNGVIPLWEPFIFLGRPHHYTLVSGVLNPVALFIFSFHFLGLNYLKLYLIYLVLYFLLGLVGFFLLCRQIFKHDAYALVATWFLTFSGLGGTLFFQINEVMLFVTGVWFFVFLLRFFDEFNVADFWGIIFCLMLSMFCCYPFYLICLLCAFSLAYATLFYKSIIQQIKNLFAFMKSHPFLLAGALACLLIASMPILLFNVLNSSGEIVSLDRHHTSLQDFKEGTGSNAQLTYKDVSNWDSLSDIYGGWDWFATFGFFNGDDFSFLPLFCFTILFMALWTVPERGTVVVFMTAFLIYLIGMGGATPVYYFLFHHIFFFKFFRNLYFFTIYLMPLIILFAVFQLKAILQSWVSTQHKAAPLIFISLGHLAFYFLLKNDGCLYFASYLTLILSFLFFVALVLGAFKHHWYLLLGCLFCLIVMEPWHLFNYYQKNLPNFTDFPVPYSHDIARFNYTRPRHDQLTEPYGPSFYCLFPMLASLKDAAGSIEFEPDLLQKYVLSFGQRFPSNQQPEYVRHKIVLYDRMPNAAKQGPSPQYVLNDSKTFKILHFDVNSLAFESNFPINKFLVYNDAYSKFWRVVINGRKEKIFLANEAFKGIFLPAGRNLVQLRYCPYGGEWVYIIVLITNCLSFIYLLFLNFNFKGRR